MSIKWGKWNDESVERWIIGFHERDKIHEGWIGFAPEFDFVVIQEWILDSVEGKTIDIENDDIRVE